MLIFIIAGTPREYHDYLRAEGINPEAARYVARPEVLRGARLTTPGQLRRIGTWTEREDLAEIEWILQGIPLPSIAA